jgi:hypothetical protein
MRRAGSFSLLCVTAGVVVACGAFDSASAPLAGGAEAGVPESGVGAVSEAGDAADAGDGTCWSRTFGAPVDVPELSSIARDLSARLSADELTAYVTSERAGGVGGRDIWVNKRASVSAPFGASALLTELDTPLQEDYASIAFDGLSLYFEHADPAAADGGGGTPDLYVARRGATSFPFPAATPVGAVNTQAGESFPYIAPLGQLYFASDREGPAGEYHLFVAPSKGATFDTPVALTSLNEPGALSTSPVVSKDGLTIYFASTRTGATSQGDYDIWVAHRAALGDSFGAPANVAELNTASGDRPTWISSDGCRILIVSDRPGTIGDLDIWLATR